MPRPTRVCPDVTVSGPMPARPDAHPSCLRGRAGTGSVAIGFRRGMLMRSLGLALLACLAVAACSTQRQTVGTAAGVAAGAVVAGPVGAVVGGAVGAVATAPGSCYYRNRYGRLRRVC